MQNLIQQLKIFENLGYRLNRNIDLDTILHSYKKNFYLTTNDIEYEFLNKQVFEGVKSKPYSNLYYHLGLNLGNRNFVTNNCLWWDLEYFDVYDGKLDFTYFMQRMGIISKGELIFENIICYDDNGNDDKYIEFTVNGVAKKWHLGFQIPDSYILRFAYLCEELNTKGKYTIYDDGGQAFVLDYATEEEQLKFNKVTKLGRIWLKDGNHFTKPTD